MPLGESPRTNLRVLETLRRVSCVTAAASGTGLAPGLDVGLDGLGEVLKVLATQIDLIRGAIECESDSLIGGRSIEVIDNFHNLRRLLHVFTPSCVPRIPDTYQRGIQ